MPKPNKGESKASYISRFMASGEANSDFPDSKQRYAVAMSMWEGKKNSKDYLGQEHPYPKAYKANYIEPGLVAYPELGPCKVCEGDPAEMKCGKDEDGNTLCEPVGEDVLVKAEALERMGKTLLKKPVVIDHIDTDGSTIADGDADGIVTKEWLASAPDELPGWRYAEFLVWNPETQRRLDSGELSVSCAYIPTDVDETGGSWHNKDYPQEILNGEHYQLALVHSPRYEDARISLVNSKTTGGKKMSWKFWNKQTGRKNSLPVDLKEKINVDGKEVPMGELLDSLEEEKPKFNDDTVFETPKGEKSLGDLKNAYRNKLKNLKVTVEGAEGAEAGHAEHAEGAAKNAEPSADGACKSCNGSGKMNAEGFKADGEKLPDLRDPKQNAADKEAEEKKNAEAKAELEKKNAADKAAADEAAKKNAEELAEKELKAAADEADKKDLEAKKNEGRRSFAALRNARDNGDDVVANIAPVGLDERLARGKEKYGKTA